MDILGFRNRIIDAITKIGIKVLTGKDEEKDALCEMFGFSILWAKAGYVNPDKNHRYDHEIIAMNYFDRDQRTTEHEISLLLHELAHATGKNGRLERAAIMRPANTYEKAVEELIAETVSFDLLHHFGVLSAENDRLSIEYIEMWLIHVPPEQHEFVTALVKRESEKAVQYILTNWLNEIAAFQPVATPEVA